MIIRITSAFKEILSYSIFFCPGINAAKGLIDPRIIQCIEINRNRFCKVPLHNIIPVKRKIFIVGLWYLERPAAYIADTGSPKLPEYICFDGYLRRCIIKINVFNKSEPW